MNLYQNLLASLYSVDGLDAEFLGSLAAPIRIDRERGARSRPVTLAVIPALRVRRLKGNVKAARRAIARHRRSFARAVESGRADSGGWLDSTEEAFSHLAELQEELTGAETALARVLA